MPKEKVERNKQFEKAWREEGLSNKELGERFNLSIGGVKGLKQRIRVRNPLYGKPHITKSPSQQVDKLPNQQIHKRITFYLKPETIKSLKLLAVEKDSNISELARKIIEKYLEK